MGILSGGVRFRRYQVLGEVPKGFQGEFEEAIARHAFQDFGGGTRRIVYDRPATVDLGSIGRDRQPLWHPRFLEFAKHYGYEPYLCRPRDPNRKGKKEKFCYPTWTGSCLNLRRRVIPLQKYLALSLSIPGVFIFRKLIWPGSQVTGLKSPDLAMKPGRKGLKPIITGKPYPLSRPMQTRGNGMMRIAGRCT